HVVGAHVVNDIDSRFAREQRSIAELHGKCPVRPMQHGLAVKSDKFDASEAGWQVLYERTDGIGMAPGDPGFQFRQPVRAFAAFSDRLRGQESVLEVSTEVGIISEESRRASLDFPLAVTLQPGDVDAVHGGAAHQADRHTLAHINPSLPPGAYGWQSRPARCLSRLPGKCQPCPFTSPNSCASWMSAGSSTRSRTPRAWIGFSPAKPLRPISDSTPPRKVSMRD